jgi:crotonobetainyl-CoA:carnitine CoA-transferase CaiB-like acyl-CoA transferase
VGRLVSPADTLEADWAVDRGAYVEVPAGPEPGDSVVVHRSALRIDGFGCGPRGGVAHLGADNRAVLAEVLGLSGAEVDALVAAGVLVERPVT